MAGVSATEARARGAERLATSLTEAKQRRGPLARLARSTKEGAGRSMVAIVTAVLVVVVAVSAAKYCWSNRARKNASPFKKVLMLQLWDLG
mmetsp:Transcript_633/g.1255  ORF Transcript_633/g.1255 Transcript_633/m.1255 type:complete len:91 (-) Transcript_633:55-327(-)